MSLSPVLFNFYVGVAHERCNLCFLKKPTQQPVLSFARCASPVCSAGRLSRVFPHSRRPFGSPRPHVVPGSRREGSAGPSCQAALTASGGEPQPARGVPLSRGGTGPESLLAFICLFGERGGGEGRKEL